MDRILEEERLIDAEIKQELEKYKLSKQIGIFADGDVREAGYSAAHPVPQAVNQQNEDDRQK